MKESGTVDKTWTTPPPPVARADTGDHEQPAIDNGIGIQPAPEFTTASVLDVP